MFKSDPILIVPYIGYQSATRLYMRGRVLEDEEITDDADDRFIRIMLNNFRRFETDEIAGAKLEIIYLGKSYRVTTDEEGFYFLDLELPYTAPATPVLMHNCKVKLLEAPGYPAQEVSAIGQVMTLMPNAAFGIISDIDDTVLQTHMTSFLKLKMLRQTFTSNAHGRKAMEGMVALYQQLARGGDGKRQNPFFYLSDSPWNLYDTITHFMENEGLPRGPLFLRDFGFNRGEKRKQFKEHKRLKIARILNAFPDLPFVLLGDTASHDADYYLEAMQQFPNRIKAIYIRQTKLNKNARRIRTLIEAAENTDVAIIEQSAEILEHARAKGLIG